MLSSVTQTSKVLKNEVTAFQTWNIFGLKKLCLSILYSLFLESLRNRPFESPVLSLKSFSVSSWHDEVQFKAGWNVMLRLIDFLLSSVKFEELVAFLASIATIFPCSFDPFRPLSLSLFHTNSVSFSLSQSVPRTLLFSVSPSFSSLSHNLFHNSIHWLTLNKLVRHEEILLPGIEP